LNNGDRLIALREISKDDGDIELNFTAEENPLLTIPEDS
jgi:hypothetical protein